MGQLAADLTGKPIANKKGEDSNMEECDANVEETALDAAEDANWNLSKMRKAVEDAMVIRLRDESENQAADDTSLTT